MKEPSILFESFLKVTYLNIVYIISSLCVEYMNKESASGTNELILEGLDKAGWSLQNLL